MKAHRRPESGHVSALSTGHFAFPLPFWTVSMARIRSVKPELRRSLTVAEWPREVRLAWVYLWGYLDDHGRGHDDMRLVIAELFPLDRDVTERKMDRWLGLMATTKSLEDELPPLCRYEVEGRRYLHAVKWHDSQKPNRPQPTRLPQCPVHGCIRCPGEGVDQ